MGRTALVTGAAGGLGRAITLALSSAGFEVVAVDLAASALSDLSSKDTAGAAIHPAPADLSDPGQTAKVVADARATVGPIDILINNAGLGPGFIRRDFLTNKLRIWEIDPEQWRTIVAVNYGAIQALAYQLIPDMLDSGWGRLINVTTNFDSMMRPFFSAYGSSKAAAEALSASLAEELKGSGVTVNVVIPGGPADTAMIPSDAPLNRSDLVPPKAMVGPIEWLCSDAADQVNGRRFIAQNWQAPEPGFDPVNVGSAIGWPDLAGADRLVPMAGHEGG